MAEAVNFPGANRVFAAPPGRGDVSDLHTFANGKAIVSAWKLSAEELEEVNRTGTVFLSSLSGDVLFPIYIGSESSVRRLVADYGKVWERGANAQPHPERPCTRPGCTSEGTHFAIILFFGAGDDPERVLPFQLEIPRLLCPEHQAAFRPQEFMSAEARASMRAMIEQWGLPLPGEPEFDAALVHWADANDPMWNRLEQQSARLVASSRREADG